MTEFLQRYFAHQNFFDLCIYEKQRLRQALNLLSNLLLTKIQLCSVIRIGVDSRNLAKIRLVSAPIRMTKRQKL